MVALLCLAPLHASALHPEPTIAGRSASALLLALRVRVLPTDMGLLRLVPRSVRPEARILLRSALLGREAMTPFNRNVVRTLTTIGNRNRRMSMTYPDFWGLDPYIRNSRCRTRGFVHTKKGVRGYIVWYVRRRYPFPNSRGDTVWWARAFRGYFTHVSSASTTHEELWALIQEREKAAKDAVLGHTSADPTLETITRMRKLGYTIKDISEAVGKSNARIGQILKGVPAYRGSK